MIISRKVLLVVISVLGVLLALYAFYFSLFGPGDEWINGQIGVPLKMQDGSGANLTELQAYFAKSASGVVTPIDMPQGNLYKYIRVSEDMQVAQIYKEDSWLEDQQIYLRTEKGAEWKELLAPLSSMTISFEGIIYHKQEGKILLTDWKPWSNSGLLRYVLSIFDITQRYERGLYLSTFDGELQYLFPGEYTVISPDSKKVIFDRYRNGMYHEIMLWNTEKDVLQTLAVVMESDPGSGRSFEYNWKDNETLYIYGEKASMNQRKFVLEYTVGDPVIKKLEQK
ncbi:MAG: hypothetical protein ACK4NC_07040 [Candidatus Gracilibacteria bacterium]